MARSEASAQTNDQQATSIDFSLRANGDTYIERSNEVRKLLDRIETSAASVIGLSGVRGAGKSSLAKLVLKTCESRGYFTILIPSPTGYEPREFLISIGQRIAEHCNTILREKVFGKTELLEEAQTQSKRLRNRIWVVLFLLVVYLTGSGYIYSSSLQNTIRHNNLLREHQGIQEELRIIEGEIGAITNIFPVTDEARSRVAVLEDKQELYKKELARNESEQNGDPIGSLVKSSLLGALPVISLVMIMLSGIYLLRLFSRYRKIRAHSTEAALMAECVDFLTLLNFQSTRSESREIGVVAKAISGTWSNSLQLEDRPLSLPGLTARCSDLLDNIARVFSGKIVICIDELDKIADPNELMELLKGLKGLFGHANTNFLLTISEDATARFTTRLTTDRNLVESSFEEIVYLDRLDRRMATAIVRQTTGTQAASANSPLEVNSLLVWVFSAGIPRELKRNLYSCWTQVGRMDEASPLEVWRMLFLSVLADVAQAKQTNVSQDVAEQYRLLVCLDELRAFVRSVDDSVALGPFLGEVCRCVENHLAGADRDEPAKSAGVEILYPEVVAVIILGASAFGIVKLEAMRPLLDSMIYASKYVSMSPRYSVYALQRLLFGRLTDSRLSGALDGVLAGW